MNGTEQGNKIVQAKLNKVNVQLSLDIEVIKNRLKNYVKTFTKYFIHHQEKDVKDFKNKIQSSKEEEALEYIKPDGDNVSIVLKVEVTSLKRLMKIGHTEIFRIS